MVINLGEDLELDPQAYELRRAGHRVRLERIPMEILLLLIERRQEMVTREQIVERIWGQSVYVETDNSINGAIRKIRQALRDDPENPRFIRTITGKGYRFIATPIVVEPAAVDAPAPALARTPPIARRWLLLIAGVVLVAAVAGAWLRRPRATVVAPEPGTRVMLAVLPFENLTGDAGQDYFTDGFTEEMITRVGGIAPRRLGVIARTSVMYYKRTQAPLDQVARELGVQYVLEGGVRRDAERVRITAQLIQVKDQANVWSRQFDRAQKDVLQVQEEISQAIADQIASTLGEDRAPRARPATFSSADYEAYEHYLKGRHYWNRRTPDDLRRSVEEFQQAIAANPQDARAYAGLADSWTLMGNYGYAPPAEVAPKARAAALKALDIDPGLAPALTSLALINEFSDWDWRTAEERFRRAIERDPNYATAHHWYAECLSFQARFDEALAEIAIARKLDPRSLIIAVDYAAMLYAARKYEQAIEEFRAVIAIEPNFPRSQIIAGAYVELGRFAEALEVIEAWQKTDHGPWPTAWLAFVQGRMGEEAKARATLRETDALAERTSVDPLHLHAFAYSGMGLREEALAALEAGCEKHHGFLVSAKVDPVYDPLRADPRFDRILRCVNLAS